MIEPQGVLLELVRNGMGWSSSDKSLIERLNSMSDEEWCSISQLAIRQGVHTIMADGLNSIINYSKQNEVDLTLPRRNLLEIIGLCTSTEQSYSQKEFVLKKLEKIFGEANIPMLVMKGMALSRWYPEPKHRSFGDIDIYLGDYYEQGNKLLLKYGGEVASMFYRHSEIMFRKHSIAF